MTATLTGVDTEVVVQRKETLADGVAGVTLRRPCGEPFGEWEPGAHVDLVLRKDLVRQYSLCGDPADRSVLRIAVLREPDGRGGSAYVHDELAEGTRVRIRGPRNHFPLVPAPRYLFLAGGIGITPLVPMIARADAAGADWRLVYGGRTRAAMAFRAELEQRWGDRVAIRPQDETGLPDLDAALDQAGADAAVYCCGPEGLLKAVEQRCASRRAGSLHVERFTPRAGADAGERTSFEVELAASGRTVTVPADKSVLEAVEEAGVPVLFSCQEGTCGTCETPVLGGVPDHRDSLLTEEERAAGDTMMICVSRSCGPRLVLDL